MLTGGEAVGIFEMPSEICSQAYSPLDEVIKKVLSPKADLRYSTALAFSNAIADALNKVEQHQITHTSDDLPPKENGKTNILPGKPGLLQESRIFLLAFVVALFFLEEVFLGC